MIGNTPDVTTFRFRQGGQLNNDVDVGTSIPVVNFQRQTTCVVGFAEKIVTPSKAATQNIDFAGFYVSENVLSTIQTRC